MMVVTVMYRNNWFGGDGWTYYPLQIHIKNTCPECGQKRGEPKPHTYCEDGDWYTVDRWENPCGHIDYYKECIIEANKLAESTFKLTI